MAIKKKNSKRSLKTQRSIFSFLNNYSKSRIIFLVSVLIFTCAGTYLLANSFANPKEILLKDRPERGLLYDGQKVMASGPCKGNFDLTTEQDEKKYGKEIRLCSIIESGPPGIDLRERDNQVVGSMRAMAEHDKKFKPAESDDDSDYEQDVSTAFEVTPYNMNGLAGRDWTCRGTGTDGARVRLLYVYPSNASNRLKSLRDGFEAIARRTNNIYYHSGKDSGNTHQIRFATVGGDSGCELRIKAEPIASDKVLDFGEIKSVLISRGYDDPLRKYLVWVDKNEKCGQGDIRSDSRPGQDNANNTSNSFAVVWRPCWNYSEPHEIMHTLGGVQPDAPYATKGFHCRDENDRMCYDDDGSGGISTFVRCSRTIDHWRLDCKHDAYYSGNDPSSGYLSNHWNTANSQFLTR